MVMFFRYYYHISTSKYDPNLLVVIVKFGVNFKKTILPAVIFKFFFWTPNFTKFLNPQGNFSALFYLYSSLSLNTPYNIYKFQEK